MPQADLMTYYSLISNFFFCLSLSFFFSILYSYLLVFNKIKYFFFQFFLFFFFILKVYNF